MVWVALHDAGKQGQGGAGVEVGRGGPKGGNPAHVPRVPASHFSPLRDRVVFLAGTVIAFTNGFIRSSSC